jgi:menaquinone-dependent protoporphyrinogen oxidase
MIRVLVAYGSERGGTEEIAEWVADTLRTRGLDVDLRRADQVEDVTGYDAVVLGGALYVGRWHRVARRFARRHAGALIHRRVWVFSSGPLDRTAREGTLEPPRGVARIMERIGSTDHITFGGRLRGDARGLLASRLARSSGGDYRDQDQVRAWAGDIARQLHETSAPDPGSR